MPNDLSGLTARQLAGADLVVWMKGATRTCCCVVTFGLVGPELAHGTLPPTIMTGSVPGETGKASHRRWPTAVMASSKPILTEDAYKQGGQVV